MPAERKSPADLYRFEPLEAVVLTERSWAASETEGTERVIEIRGASSLAVAERVAEDVRNLPTLLRQNTKLAEALRKIVKFSCRRVPTKCEPDNRCEVCIAEAALAKLDEQSTLPASGEEGR